MSWEWFNTGAGAASIVGLIVTIGSVISGWHLKRLQADIHASTQLTLTDMRKGFSESHEHLAASQKAIAEAVSGIGQILERMDQRADERHRDTITAIDTLRRP
jgi:hypothetical protein